MYPDDVKYAQTHEWVRVDGETATVGITFHAAEELGDVVNIELPKVGTELCAGDAMGSVDSVKAASDIISPVSGEIIQVNDILAETPEIVMGDAYGTGWIAVLKMKKPSEIDLLMTADQYRQCI